MLNEKSIKKSMMGWDTVIITIKNVLKCKSLSINARRILRRKIIIMSWTTTMNMLNLLPRKPMNGYAIPPTNKLVNLNLKWLEILEVGFNLLITHQDPSKRIGSRNTSTTNYPLVKHLCLNIVKGSSYIMGGNHYTRSRKICIKLISIYSLFRCYNVLRKPQRFYFTVIPSVRINHAK